MPRRLPATHKMRLGALLALAALVAATSVGLQAQAEDLPQPSGGYAVAMHVDVHGQVSAPRLLVGSSSTFALAGDSQGKPWRVEFALQRLAPDGQAGEQVRLAGRIIDNGQTVASPVLVGALGQRMTVRAGEDLSVSLVVTGG